MYGHMNVHEHSSTCTITKVTWVLVTDPDRLRVKVAIERDMSILANPAKHIRQVSLGTCGVFGLES